MSDEGAQLSNPFSTGGGGHNFENHVQAGFDETSRRKISLRERKNMDQQIGKKLKHFADYASKEKLGQVHVGGFLRQVEDPYELITPTGAALLAEFSSSFGSLPEMKIEKIGYGLGTRESGPRPNVLRALLGECGNTSNAEVDEIMQLETNLDDLSPELAGVAMERLFAGGALDVFFTAAQMKKNRPGFVLTVLCTEEKSSELARILLTETTAFGVRMHHSRRLKLRREFDMRETPYGPVRIKFGLLGDQLVQIVPEYESCREVAKRAGVSVRDVQIAAMGRCAAQARKSGA